MHQHQGLGIGIDRLVILMTNQHTIRYCSSTNASLKKPVVAADGFKWDRLRYTILEWVPVLNKMGFNTVGQKPPIPTRKFF